MKSVIHGMMLYSFLVYSWLVSFLKEVDRWVRNFIWSGDVNKKKVVTMAWHKCCSPIDEGGLGLRSLRQFNEAAGLKLYWEFVNSDKDWASLLRARVLRKHGTISYRIFSSVWSSIKGQISVMKENSSWQLGNGSEIRFWTDNWLDDSLVNICNIPAHLHSNLNSKVTDYIRNGSWSIPRCIIHAFPVLGNLLQDAVIPQFDSKDQMVWKNSNSGELGFKDAYLHIKPIR